MHFLASYTYMIHEQIYYLLITYSLQSVYNIFNIFGGVPNFCFGFSFCFVLLVS